MRSPRNSVVTLIATLALAIGPVAARADEAADRAIIERGARSVARAKELTTIGIERIKANARRTEAPTEAGLAPSPVALAPGGPEEPVEPDPGEPVPTETLNVYPLRSPEGETGLWMSAMGFAVLRARLAECNEVEALARETPPPACPECGDGLDAWALAGGTGAAVGFAVGFLLFGLR